MDAEVELEEPISSAQPRIDNRQPKAGEAVGEWFLERAKFIPLRLTLTERKYLRLLDAALQVSEYTDKVDILMYGSKVKRIVQQIREICAILSGLVLAADYKQVSFMTPHYPSMRLRTCFFRDKSSSRIVTLRPTPSSTRRSSSLDEGTRS